MGAKLSAANPYLRDPAVRRRTVFTSVSSSSAIEGIRAPFKQMEVDASAGAAEKSKVPPRKRRTPVKL